tara:strand:- start:380 stop:715 length:336 start_codon:yes stop_codon:yes gene_type:complete
VKTKKLQKKIDKILKKEFPNLEWEEWGDEDFGVYQKEANISEKDRIVVGIDHALIFIEYHDEYDVLTEFDADSLKEFKTSCNSLKEFINNQAEELLEQVCNLRKICKRDDK